MPPPPPPLPRRSASSPAAHRPTLSNTVKCQGGGGRGVWLGPLSSLGPLMAPAKGGPKKLQSSWRRRGQSKILAVSLKDWKGKRGGGGRGGVQGGGGNPPCPTVYSRSDTSLVGWVTHDEARPCMRRGRGGGGLQLYMMFDRRCGGSAPLVQPPDGPDGRAHAGAQHLSN